MGLLFANRALIALPPIWLFCAGFLIAAVAAVVVWGLLKLLAPRAADELRASLSEGFLGPMAWLLMGLSALAVALTPLVPIEQIGRSLVRLVTAGEETTTLSIPPNSEFKTYELDLRPQELASLKMESDRSLLVRTQQPIAGFALLKVPDVDLLAGAPWEWIRSKGDTNPFLGVRAKLEVTNSSSEPAALTIRSTLVPEYPEVAILPWTAVVILSIRGPSASAAAAAASGGCGCRHGERGSCSARVSGSDRGRDRGDRPFHRDPVQHVRGGRQVF